MPAALGHMVVFRLHSKKMELTSVQTNGPVSPFCGRTQTHLANSCLTTIRKKRKKTVLYFMTLGKGEALYGNSTSNEEIKKKINQGT